jgi:tetratricopeptide (TPR) repeat protein
MLGITRGEQRVGSVIVASSGALGAAPDDDALLLLRNASSPFGARVERLVNGLVVATLPAQSTPTDLAARAARCALAMQAVVPDALMALATGRADVSAPFPGWDAIDRAVQFQAERAGAQGPGALACGQIPICSITAGLLDARFEVRGVGAGLALVGEREIADEPRTLLGRRTPFVGRERDLDGLVGLFDECAGEPVARVALVIAPAGVGKSRLLTEFLQTLMRRRAPHELWRARGDPMRAGSPFSVVAPILRRTAGVLDGELLDSQRHKLQARIGRHVSDAQLPRVTTFLGEIAGIRFAEDATLRAAHQQSVLMNDQMRRAWEDFVAAECAATPLVIAIEDLQWGDLPSVQLLDAVLRSSHERPLMVVATARPEIHDVFPTLWSEREVQELRLGALTRRAGEQLARGGLGAAAEEHTVQRVVTLAAGNAFYLEELIRAVAAGKGQALPETAVAMAEARLLMLEPEARRVLRAASVFGSASWPGGVRALLGRGPWAHDVDVWLERLVERELLTKRSECRFAGETEYAFRHELLRAAAYAMLTDEDRSLGHQLAGGWLEAQGEPDSLALADHFERAGERSRAAAWYLPAAQQALDGNDFAGVVARVERAVACGAAGEVLGALRLLEAQVRRWRMEFAECARLAKEAMDLLPRGSRRWFLAVGELVSLDPALARAEAAFVQGILATKPGDDATTARAIALASGTFQGWFLTVPHLKVVLDDLLRVDAAMVGDPLAKAQLLRARGRIALIEGDHEPVVRLVEQSIASSEEAGDLRGASLQRSNLAFAYSELGDYRRAIECARESLSAATVMGLPRVIAMAKQNLGFALARDGELDEARRVETEAVDMLVAAGDRRLVGFARAYLADILTRAGALVEAEKQATAALDTLGEHSGPRAYALSVLAGVLLRLGRSAEALQRSSEAMSTLETQGGLEEGESHLRLTYAEALHAAGDRERAEVAIAAARERLLARASKFNDEAWRASFLERVEENRRTLQLAEAWRRR